MYRHATLSKQNHVTLHAEECFSYQNQESFKYQNGCESICNNLQRFQKLKCLSFGHFQDTVVPYA